MVCDDEAPAKLAANQRNWDARAPIHVGSAFYGVGQRDPESWFADFEWRDLGELGNREVAHLQCRAPAMPLGHRDDGIRAQGC
ncbi:hypothetical protein MKUB_04280 [Mycobacterium kubicae]|uniref:Uncharacterized protein n=1 Tax=Mycobacterium kubicae TaxID=120959 RepID=A0ABQ1BGW1_9MYCO|nr:hypothetical protein MKUB_04280 [Mycobacterium kubicae]